ncbi:MAG: helix-turn-helix domain-containing protein [Clostridiales bacterium]|nr:helix-turn-helix domain-containing protein [Clostridiales bacterium]
MELTLDTCLYFISDLNPKIIRKTKNDRFFVGVKQFFAGMEREDHIPTDLCGEKVKKEQGEAAYLYIAGWKELWDNREVLTAEMTIFAVQDLDKQDLNFWESGFGSLPCTLVLVEGDYPVPYLVNRMVDVFSRLVNWDKMMHVSALEGKSVQELVDLSTEILKYPVMIYDPAFDVIAATRNVKGEYGFFQHTLEKGYTDANVMSLVQKNNINERLKDGGPLVGPAAGDETKKNVFLSFSDGQTLLGNACIFHVCYDQSYQEKGYLDLLPFFAESITFCLKRDYEQSRYGQMMYETFLLNLMNPGTFSEERLSEQVQNMEGLKMTGRFVLEVVAFENVENIPLQFLVRLLDRELWNVKPFLYERQACLLKTLNPEWEADDIIKSWEMRSMDELLADYPFSVGISNVFFRIQDLRFAYLQAKAALQFKKPQTRYMLYGDIYYHHLFSVFEREMPVSCLRPEFYLKMKDYDKEHRTDYCRIILTYLECDCNATHAAEQLFLHRNTVRNAVRFAEEHWGIRVADTEVKKKMVLSDLIDRYLSAEK